MTGYRARAAVRVELDGSGRPRLTRLRSDGPLVLRGRVSQGIAVVHLVGGAAAPGGGDELALELEVGPGTSLEFGSVAASMVHPGPTGAPSAFRVTAVVAEGGSLVYRPEPAVAVAGCRHFAGTTIEAASDARVVWREELVLGRHREASGRYESRLDASVAGRPLLRHGFIAGDPETDRSGAVLAGAKAVGSVLLIGGSEDGSGAPAPFAAPGFAVQPLTGPGVLVTAVAPDAVLLRARLDEGTHRR